MRHRRRNFLHPLGGLLIFLLPLGAAASVAGGEPGWHHGFSEAFFEVFLDGRRASEYVIMTVRLAATDPPTVEAHVAFLTEDAARQGTRIAIRSYSTVDGSITGAALRGDTLSFELLLDGKDADRKVRLRSIRDQNTGVSSIKAGGLWSDQTHTTFVRAQWRPVKRIELRYPQLISPGHN